VQQITLFEASAETPDSQTPAPGLRADPAVAR
jgi:hypothetical protein